MREFRMSSAKGKLTHTIVRYDADENDTEIVVEVEYYFEPEWAPSFDDPGSGASASFTVIKPEGLTLTDEELDEIETAILYRESDRQIAEYEHAAEMAWEASRGN